MCASALRQLRFKKVYFGCWNDKFGGCGGVVDVHQELVFQSEASTKEDPFEARMCWLIAVVVMIGRVQRIRLWKSKEAISSPRRFCFCDGFT